MWRLHLTNVQPSVVELKAFLTRNRVAQYGDTTIYGESAGPDPAFDFTS